MNALGAPDSYTELPCYRSFKRTEAERFRRSWRQLAGEASTATPSMVFTTQMDIISCLHPDRSAPTKPGSLLGVSLLFGPLITTNVYNTILFFSHVVHFYSGQLVMGPHRLSVSCFLRKTVLDIVLACFFLTKTTRQSVMIFKHPIVFFFVFGTVSPLLNFNTQVFYQPLCLPLAASGQSKWHNRLNLSICRSM